MTVSRYVQDKINAYSGDQNRANQDSCRVVCDDLGGYALSVEDAKRIRVVSLKYKDLDNHIVSMFIDGACIKEVREDLHRAGIDDEVACVRIVTVLREQEIEE